MSTAPRQSIDPKAFWHDPYPVLETMRANTPIVYVPELGATLFTRRDDIVTCEKNIDVFSSHQPDGLMNRLMGHNLMRKDGREHLLERKAMFPAVNPAVVKKVWRERFQSHADRILERLAPLGEADLLKDYAMPVSAEALKDITGLTDARFDELDAWSQAMIDGIANYTGVADIEARCHAATSAIDACIDRMIPRVDAQPDTSMLSVLRQAGLADESVRANIKLAISGGQNEPRDAIAGMIWAMLSHPEQLATVQAGDFSWQRVFDEYVRWISPIGMSPRRIAKVHDYQGVSFEPDERVFFMFNSANRDEQYFDRADVFDVRRNASQHIAFGAGPHFCAGAAASKVLIAEVAVPTLFERLPGLELDGDEVTFGGWAFRGPLSLRARWRR